MPTPHGAAGLALCFTRMPGAGSAGVSRGVTLCYENPMNATRYRLLGLGGLCLASLLFVAAGGWCALGVPEPWSSAMCGVEWLVSLAAAGALWFEFRSRANDA